MTEDTLSNNKSKIVKFGDPKTLAEITKLIAMGHTLGAVAAKFGVSANTFKKYRDQNPAIQAAVDQGMNKTIADVVNSLLKAAKGYYKNETQTIKVKDKDTGKWVEVKQVVTKKWNKPSDKAMTFYLINKDPENWTSSEKAAVQVVIQGGVDKLSKDQLAEKLAAIEDL